MSVALFLLHIKGKAGTAMGVTPFAARISPRWIADVISVIFIHSWQSQHPNKVNAATVIWAAHTMMWVCIK